MTLRKVSKRGSTITHSVAQGVRALHFVVIEITDCGGVRENYEREKVIISKKCGGHHPLCHGISATNLQISNNIFKIKGLNSVLVQELKLIDE